MRVLDGEHLHRVAVSSKLFAIVVAVSLVPEPVLAHLRGGSPSGFQSGFTHPIVGIDHLLAMLAVGIWGAQMGGRSVWTLPVSFPIVMAAGGILGMSAIVLPHIELGIALSVFVLGLAIALAWKAPQWLALLLIAVFAVCHGYAHGAELPKAVDPASYANGFVLATGLIHVAGIGIGFMFAQVWEGRCQRQSNFAAVGRSKSAAAIEARRSPIGGLLASNVLVSREYYLACFALACRTLVLLCARR